MKFFIFFAMFLIITGCVTKDQKPRVYTNKITFHKWKTQKKIYAKAELEMLPKEYYKINFPDTEVAENKLNIQMLYRLNEYNKSFIPVAQKEIKQIQAFTADLRAKISERNNQHKQIEELKKQIQKSNHHILKRKF